MNPEKQKQELINDIEVHKNDVEKLEEIKMAAELLDHSDVIEAAEKAITDLEAQESAIDVELENSAPVVTELGGDMDQLKGYVDPIQDEIESVVDNAEAQIKELESASGDGELESSVEKKEMSSEDQEKLKKIEEDIEALQLNIINTLDTERGKIESDLAEQYNETVKEKIGMRGFEAQRTFLMNMKESDIAGLKKELERTGSIYIGKLQEIADEMKKPRNEREQENKTILNLGEILTQANLNKIDSQSPALAALKNTKLKIEEEYSQIQKPKNDPKLLEINSKIEFYRDKRDELIKQKTELLDSVEA